MEFCVTIITTVESYIPMGFFYTPGYSGPYLSGAQIKEPEHSVYQAVLMSIHNYKTGPFTYLNRLWF